MAYVKCVHGEAACRLGRINMDANRSTDDVGLSGIWFFTSFHSECSAVLCESGYRRKPCGRGGTKDQRRS
jgi:hypothetical protein